MTNKIDRTGLRSEFWRTVPLTEMNSKEWEALCDGCGKCCLNKLEDEDSGEVLFTRVACRLLDDQSCQCAQYDIRREFVPECVVLKPSTIKDVAYWLPMTCAYRLLHEGKPLCDWHPLISGDPETVHTSGTSVRGWTVPEYELDVEDWENYIIEDLS
ncbi:YcgN family cysteine cluster protein [Falsihalocynthiibacter sp. SS001]|uniref:YcgN family cysteine cluster protein n=1 Tax=Falsihalocynthiibacter sp. SS001 TaxID=3349698 RepID=UPI0036D39F1E